MITYIEPAQDQWAELLLRPSLNTQNLDTIVQEVVNTVREEGDQALKAYTEKFDRVALDTLEVSKEEIAEAVDSLTSRLKVAIQTARDNIRRFHAAQREEEQVIETMPGVSCWRRSVAIDKVGLYIPGGTAPLFSSVLMLGVPAKIAGCQEIILCTPPQKDGKVHPAILYTASLVGITRIFKVGGAQAIVAMAYGTETIPSVYKIFGPGNQYVTAAKQLVSRQGVAIDMPAGPSEVLVYADRSARPAFVAADLLSQAEHGTDSQVVLITDSAKMLEDIKKEVQQQLDQLPRKEIAAEALENSVAILLADQFQAIQLINTYAPEHLILALENAEAIGLQITNAGSVFLGHYTPESVGDYASGTNHTLPTNGYARMYSGVSLDSFIKKITYQRLTKDGLARIGPAVEELATAEHLMAHKNAVSIRLKNQNNEIL